MTAIEAKTTLGGTDARPATSAPPVATGRTTRFPCFDGLRAIAAITVVMVHTSFQSGVTPRTAWGPYTSRLEIGVAVFFLISGFLLYRPFAAAHFGGRGAPRWRTFWARRLLRIVPAYWLALTVLVYWFNAASVGHTAGSIATYYGFAQIYFPGQALYGLTQAWSLCTEMTFYLMLPMLAWAIARRRRSPEAQLRVELVTLVVMVAVSFAFRIVMFSIHTSLTQGTSSWLPANLDLFALGMLLAVASVWWAQVRHDQMPRWLDHPLMPWISWATAAGLYVAVSNIGIPVVPLYHISIPLNLLRQTLYALFAFFLLLPAVFGPQDRSAVRALLRWRPVVGLGVVSYGIYLWHQAWITLFFRWTGDVLFRTSWWQLTLFAVATATASATLSYVLVERPILSLKRRFPMNHPPVSPT